MAEPRTKRRYLWIYLWIICDTRPLKGPYLSHIKGHYSSTPPQSAWRPFHLKRSRAFHRWVKDNVRQRTNNPVINFTVETRGGPREWHKCVWASRAVRSDVNVKEHANKHPGKNCQWELLEGVSVRNQNSLLKMSDVWWWITQHSNLPHSKGTVHPKMISQSVSAAQHWHRQGLKHTAHLQRL